MSLRKTKGGVAGGKIERDEEYLDFILNAKFFILALKNHLCTIVPFQKKLAV